MPDSIAVRTMFGRIARRYDIANRLLSSGMDVFWRKKLVRAVHDVQPVDLLDLATGSGDVAFALADGLPSGVAITGMDFCQPMLDEAEKKRATDLRWKGIRFCPGDGLALPLSAENFDVVTISFGLRNMADRHKCLTEIRRVLRPGGKLFVLEFSQPDRWFRPIYFVYLRTILPRIAAIVTGEKSAYDYLCGSIEEFPDRNSLSAEIVQAGFSAVSATPFTFGVVALHQASA
jgi:demethylmenaquinone methyltransferase / 2-methoxy-6-polyprenyl-1,4-benzoquinol methylase